MKWFLSDHFAIIYVDSHLIFTYFYFIFWIDLFSSMAHYIALKVPFILRKIVKLLSYCYILVSCIMLFDVDLFRFLHADNDEMDREREKYKKTRESELICAKWDRERYV